MTVETDLDRAQYATNATTGPWTVPFYFLESDEIAVTWTDANGTDTLLTLDTHYSVAGAGDENGGTITTASAYLAGGKLTIVRDMNFVQETEYVDGDAFPAKTHERALDRLTMIGQQLKELFNRSLRFAVSDTNPVTLPTATARANTVLAFDDDGNIVPLIPASGSAVDVMIQYATSIGASLIGWIQGGIGAVRRALHVKLREISVTPQDYGALGNGTTASLAVDADAINAAMVYLNARGGGVLRVPVGAYRLNTQILLLPGVSIVCDAKGAWSPNGAPGVSFSKEFTTGSVFFSPNTQSIISCEFSDFYIVGNKGGLGGSNGSGIEIQLGNDNIFRRVWNINMPSNGFAIGQGSGSYHNYFYNCYSLGAGASGYLNQSDWTRLIDCWADTCYIGVDFPNNDMCGSNAHVERGHFEENTLAAIAVRGDPAVGGNGDNRLRDNTIYARPYNDSDPSHGIFFDSTTAPAGCSGNQVSGNKVIYQNTHGPAKTGKFGIYFFGGQGGSNIVDDNAVSGFDIDINILPGSVRNSIASNYVDGANVGINNAAAQTKLDGNVYTNNIDDLTPTGALAIATGEYYTVAPTFLPDAFTSDNNLGSRGDWTPHLMFGGGSVGIAYAAGKQLGRFEKTGRTVHAWIAITLTSKGTSTGLAEFDLPVTPAQLQSPTLVYVSAGGSGITGTVFGYVNPSSGRFTLAQGAGTLLTDANFSGTTSLVAHLTYET